MVRYTLELGGTGKLSDDDLKYLKKCCEACEPKGLPVFWQSRQLAREEVGDGDGVEVVVK